MANTDSLNIRVFSLNCWSVVVVCRDYKCTVVVVAFLLRVCKNTVFVYFFRGIRYVSKHTPQRYAMIGDMLCKEEHDVVLLQEVGGRRLSEISSCRVG